MHKPNQSTLFLLMKMTSQYNQLAEFGSSKWDRESLFVNCLWCGTQPIWYSNFMFQE